VISIKNTRNNEKKVEYFMKNRINGMLWRIELNMALVFLGIGRWRVEPNDLSLRLQRFVIASAARQSPQ
jgi:hypothetical protein